MEKHIYDENNGLHYTLSEDGMYYPDLVLPTSTNYPIGKYGRMRETYLIEHRKVTYNRLIMEGKLYEHLHEIDETANDQVDNIVSSMAKADGTNEEFKATNQMEWVGRMNNYKHCAEEIVLKELVYD